MFFRNNEQNKSTDTTAGQGYIQWTQVNTGRMIAQRSLDNLKSTLDASELITILNDLLSVESEAYSNYTTNKNTHIRTLALMLKDPAKLFSNLSSEQNTKNKISEAVADQIKELIVELQAQEKCAIGKSHG